MFRCFSCCRLLLAHRRWAQVSYRSRTVRKYSHDEFVKISHHLSSVLERHSSLLEKITDEHRPIAEDSEKDEVYRTLAKLEPIVELAKQLECKENEKSDLEMLCKQQESELVKLAEEELQMCCREIERLESSLVNALIPQDGADRHSAVMEVRAGAGGKEAALFTAEMFLMYRKYATFKGWDFEVLSEDITEKGGIKYASAGLNGDGVFGCMKHESGVHRVQRVPVTEASGRIHTSTMSVVILPQPTEVEVSIKAADLKVETLKASGAGGQHVNTTDSAVRLTHIPTGMVIHIQDERSQHKNRAKALKLLRAKLYEKQRYEMERERSENRALQIGTGERSEKIRTYNYPQDRVTDHKLGSSIYGVVEFLAGEHVLDDLIQRLCLKEKADAIASLTTQSSH